MSDLLLANLRTIGTHHCDGEVGKEAADEIERLRAELAAARAELEVARDGWHMANGVAELAMKHRDMAEAEAARLLGLIERVAIEEPHDHMCDAVIEVKGDEHPFEERCDCFKSRLRAALQEGGR